MSSENMTLVISKYHQESYFFTMLLVRVFKTSYSPHRHSLCSFMGKGVIKLPPREVYDSLRNPQLRFTYDNMLKVCSIHTQ